MIMIAGLSWLIVQLSDRFYVSPYSDDIFNLQKLSCDTWAG